MGHSESGIFPVDLKALIFDVDGTLYNQKWIRYIMLLRLLRTHMFRPMQCVSALKIIRAYRRALETIRILPSNLEDLAEVQLQVAIESTGFRPEYVRSCVTRWMEQEPLDLLPGFMRKGLLRFLEAARSRELLLGVFSDYHPDAKLEAMGIAHLFDAVVSARDPEVQRLKPDPRGIKVTLQRLGVTEKQAIYIGDRTEIDALAALNAGVACVIIGHGHRTENEFGWIGVSDYNELDELLCRYLS